MSLRPEACPMFDVLEGTLPMYTRPAVIGRVNFMVSFQPHIFMTEAALGLSSEGDTEKSSWWVALDGKYYLYMSRGRASRAQVVQVWTDMPPRVPQPAFKSHS